ncbi:dihydroneopterin aldolase [Sulfurimonas sp.]|uniref:dihydroneopterin aldolase n=1 Tax=Sulfurimonas sp. TaxID=2022749 RepID=UPI0025F84F5D|nr:dihydroneopterin aldolase [Sulfurimonas sp.]
MTIHIEDLKFKCIIGILDFERVTPQDVIINMTIDYKYEKEFINYAQIVEIIKETMLESEFLLIEEALDNLNLKLIKEYSSIKSMFIKITKPSILPECMVSVSNSYKY